MMEPAFGTGATPGSFAATGLGKLYRSGSAEVHALRGVDLAIPKGEMLVQAAGRSLAQLLAELDRLPLSTLVDQPDLG